MKSDSGLSCEIAKLSFLISGRDRVSLIILFAYLILGFILGSATNVFANNPPVAEDDSARTNSNTPVSLNVTWNDDDPDGNPVSLISNPITIPPSFGTAIKISANWIQYTPNTGFGGDDTFQYEVGDGNGGRSRATVTINVNRRPSAVNDSASTLINNSVTITVTSNDTDPDGDTISLISNPIIIPPSNGVASKISDTKIQYTPSNNFTGSDSFQYEIGDNRAGRSSASVTISVLNNPPQANNDQANTHANTAVTINVTANDSDPDGHSISLIGNPVVVPPVNGNAIKISASTIQYTPSSGFGGSDSFQYEIGDGFGARARATVTVSVVSINNPPVAVNDSATTRPGQPVAIVVTANDYDPDGDIVAIANPMYSPPVQGSSVVKLSSTTIQYTPAPGFTGTDSFQYEIGDGRSARATATLSVSVQNSPPLAVNDTASTGINTPITIQVTANDSDPDGDPVNIASVIVPAQHGTAVKVTGTAIKYTPASGYSGSDSFQYEIGDGFGARGQATVTVGVNVNNQPPSAVDDSASTALNTPVTIDVVANDSDPNGDTLTLTANPIVSPPGKGTAQRTSNTKITYTPNQGATGNDAFIYEVNDGRGGRGQATVAISIAQPNQPNFVVSISPVNQSVVQGLVTTCRISISGQNGFNSPVALSVTGFPQQVSASFSPATINPGGTSTLRVSTPLSVEGNFNFEVKGTSGSIQRTVNGSLRIISRDTLPRIDSISPELIPVGTLTTVTLNGANFSGATAYIGTKKVNDTDPERFYPAVRVLSISPQGGQMRVEIDATDTRIKDYYALYIQNSNGPGVVHFRAAPEGPVIDFWTPSQVIAGDLYVMDLVGVNLSGTTVSVEGGQAIGLITEDNIITGYLKMNPGTLPGMIRVRDGQGRETTIEIDILERDMKLTTPTSAAMKDTDGTPILFMQPASMRKDLARGKPEPIENKAFGGICFEFEQTRRAVSRTWSTTLFKNPLTGDWLPIADEILRNLPAGQKIDLHTRSAVRWFHMELGMSFIVCPFSDTELWDISACFRIEAGFHVPIVGGAAFDVEFCYGSGGPSGEINLTGTGLLSSIQFHKKFGGGTGGTRDPLQCVLITDRNPESLSGERIFDVEAIGCGCSEEIAVSWDAQVYVGGFSAVNHIVGDVNLQANDNCVTVRIAAFIPSNYVEINCPFPSGPCNGNLRFPLNLFTRADDRSWSADYSASSRVKNQSVLYFSHPSGLVIPDLPLRDASPTRDYYGDAVTDDGRITNEDDDGVEDDCKEFVRESTPRGSGPSIQAFKIGINKIEARLSASLGSGYSPFLPRIDYNIRLTIDRALREFQISGFHDCMPAYEIYINGLRVYQWMNARCTPEFCDCLEILKCLPGSGDVMIPNGWRGNY